MRRSKYGLRVLRDDQSIFPAYRAVFLYRLDLLERAPQVAEQLHRLQGLFTEEIMIQLNSFVVSGGQSERQVASTYLRNEPHVEVEQDIVVNEQWHQFWQHTKDHLILVVISLVAAILVAIPLGILAAKVPMAEQPILGVVGVIYTIFMIPLLGIGGPPAIVALFLYSLLPIVRNTHAGLKDIPPSLQESAIALGLPPLARLKKIELPLATRSILAGIQTSAVINVGTATLGALIGAGGYGQPILTGIRLNDTNLILQGAIPAAVLALLVQGLFELAGRLLIPKGLRIQAG